MHFVASPRHADCLLVTGPITRNMADPLKRTYEATPGPKIVVAIGDSPMMRRLRARIWCSRTRVGDFACRCCGPRLPTRAAGDPFGHSCGAGQNPVIPQTRFQPRNSPHRCSSIISMAVDSSFMSELLFATIVCLGAGALGALLTNRSAKAARNCGLRRCAAWQHFRARIRPGRARRRKICATIFPIYCQSAAPHWALIV